MFEQMAVVWLKVDLVRVISESEGTMNGFLSRGYSFYTSTPIK